MIDQDLLARLQQLNTAAGSRVYFDTVPQKVSLPAIVIRRAGGERPRTLSGVALFERSTFEITVLAREHSQSYATASAIKKLHLALMSSLPCMHTPKYAFHAHPLLRDQHKRVAR